MHPILARSGRLALYLALWVLVGTVFAALLQGRVGFGWPEASALALPLASAYAFVCLSAWYVARSMPLVSTSTTRVVVTGLTAAVLSSALWLGLGRVWMIALAQRGWLTDVMRSSGGLDTVMFGFGILLYLFSLTISYLLATYESAREAERRALRGQVLAREAELRSLRAQIDPHFLFNSLHAISALTAADPAAARRACILLAEFLRETLALGGESRITMGRELKLAERFLAMARVRFGTRLEVDITAEAGVDGCLVPPLLLQPIVENAVTHGVAHVLDGGTIRIAASRSPGRVSILIENPCDADRPRGRGTGLGLANVRARLHAVHGAEASIHAAERDGLWQVSVSLPAATEQ